MPAPIEYPPQLAPFGIEPYSPRVLGLPRSASLVRSRCRGRAHRRSLAHGRYVPRRQRSTPGQTAGHAFASFPSPAWSGMRQRPSRPLLIKVLFAREKLSVQVHPDDRWRKSRGSQGKDGVLVRACRRAWSAGGGRSQARRLLWSRFAQAWRRHSGAEPQCADVAPGDMIFVDAGTVHAIWPGSIVLETQQNCDITYRMFDYGRPRELHIEKSLEATDSRPTPARCAAPRAERPHHPDRRRVFLRSSECRSRASGQFKLRARANQPAARLPVCRCRFGSPFRPRL